ncbi:translation initiation factor IF-2 [Collariella sp. IMI 366227]|nr:translation initiation factor IF-2 [Collariella sp. IMI 366227]
MMRRGLWQQKQKQPTACLLCRFTYGFGPYTRPAPRPSSSPDGTVSSNPTSIRPYSGLAARGRNGGLGSLGDPRRPAGPAPAVGSGNGSLFQRFFSDNGLPSWAIPPATPTGTNNALPSWASQEVQPVASGDGLLPHERAARERALTRKPPPLPPSPEPAKPPPSNNGRLPGERDPKKPTIPGRQPQKPPSNKLPFLPFGASSPISKTSPLPFREPRKPVPASTSRSQPPRANKSQATSATKTRPSSSANAVPRPEVKKAALPEVKKVAQPEVRKVSQPEVRLSQPAVKSEPTPATRVEAVPAAEPVVTPKTTAKAVPPTKVEAGPASESNTSSSKQAETAPSSEAEDTPTDSTGAASPKATKPTPAPKPKPPAAPTAPSWAPGAPSWASETPSWAATTPSWAAAAPSWASPVPSSSPVTPASTAAPDTDAPPTKADPLAGLLPHERAARERALANKAPPPPPPLAPAATQPDPLAGLLPHERAAREKALARKQPPAPAPAPAPVPRVRLCPTPSPQEVSNRTTTLLVNMYHYRAVVGGHLGTDKMPSWATLTPPPAPAAPTPSPQTTKQSSLESGKDQWAILEKQLDQQERAARQAARAAKSNNVASWDLPARGNEGTRGLEEEELGQKSVQKVKSSADAWYDTNRITRREERAIERGDQSIQYDRPVRDDRSGRDDRSVRDDRYGRDDRRGRDDRSGRDEGVDRRKRKTPSYKGRKREVDDDWEEDPNQRRRRKAERARMMEIQEEPQATPIFLPEYISVANLAAALGQKVDIFVYQLEQFGFEDVGKDNILTGETAAMVALEYGFDPTVDSGEEEDLKPRPPPEDPSSLPLRPPVVTIMGHVDHGKTTLLDYLRKSSIVSQEHGGITQHIGAFSVSLSSGKPITFLDTPGHAAFLSMRQRGATVTDMVILVVAADDSVMPQTLEALKHARAAKVPIIVAVNKVDKPEANVDRVKSDLANQGVEIEDFGGDVQVVPVSGKTGQGMDDLEENILLLSEMLDIRAEPDGMAEGWVLESTIKPIGRVATVLVKRGTLRPGDFIVAGRVHAKIRSLRNEAGVEVDEALPGTAVEVLGWKEPPDAGDQVLQAPDEGKAKNAVRYRQEQKERGEIIGQMAQIEQDRQKREEQRAREKAAEEAAGTSRRRRHNSYTPAGLDENPEAAAEAGGEESPAEQLKQVPFIVKGDVHGSVEAVSLALMEQGNNEIRAKVLISAPGQIVESDVELAAVAGADIINFNNTIPVNIKRLAHEANVKIMDHNIIYHLVEEVRAKLTDELPALVIKKVVGEAEVLQVFQINLRGRTYKNIAGCKIGNGVVKKGSKARVIRGGENVYEGVIDTLKHVKKDVDEMKKGSECGMSFAEWDQLQAGDLIQVIEEYTEKRKL